MQKVGYFRPETLEEALELLAAGREEYKILAGGTDLVLHLRERKVSPKALVDITHISALKGIREEEGKIIIKAATTFTEVASSPIVLEKIPALADACKVVGSPQIRNQGTIGGNIVNASPAADSVPALVLFDGVARLTSKRGTREILLTELLQGVGKTAIEPDELLEEVILTPYPGSVSGFCKLGRRNALAIARISGAVELVFAGSKIAKARVALGSVAPNPFRATELEQFLNGREFNEETKEELIALAKNLVAEKLGNRASAPYKREAIAGVMREILNRIEQRRGR
jgi:carbon-monoxide dehydrogenase medium subunit